MTIKIIHRSFKISPHSNLNEPKANILQGNRYVSISRKLPRRFRGIVKVKSHCPIAIDSICLVKYNQWLLPAEGLLCLTQKLKEYEGSKAQVSIEALFWHYGLRTAARSAPHFGQKELMGHSAEHNPKWLVVTVLSLGSNRVSLWKLVHLAIQVLVRTFEIKLMAAKVFSESQKLSKAHRL